MFKIIVLISGSGTNLQSIIDSIKSGGLNCSIEAVISDREGAFGLSRAAGNGIKTYTFDRRLFKGNISDEILRIADNKADLIVLAGFLSVLSGEILKRFKNRVINIHPALIPSFCGHGMYGLKVHESAIEYGVKVSGCTVHFVDEGTDTGPVILQKTVDVDAKDSPKDLQLKVLKKEHEALCEVIRLMIEGRINVEGRKVKIV